MNSPLAPKNQSPYREFTRNPREDLRPRDPHYDEPLTMVDRDGSTLYEYDGGLLHKIILQDDAQFLERYFTLTPWKGPSVPPLGGEHEILDDMCFFQLVATHGCLGVLKTLLNNATKGMDPTQRIRFRPREFELLNEAARLGHVEIVRFLLNNQPVYADIHEKDHWGNTPILSAADIYRGTYGRIRN
ncbi:hypothetical protein ACKAV7_013103 [Fusarium commune]